MTLKFGTSGLRGLVDEFSESEIRRYIQAFLQTCPHGGGVWVGQDLRPSSLTIAETVLAAISDAGLDALDCGILPTPALALAAMSRGQAAIMVTGSHIPADRNGLKFYRPDGEISKADETRILAALADPPAPGTQSPRPRNIAAEARAEYLARYVTGFGPGALAGLRLAVYQHSSAARDMLPPILSALGAEVVTLGRSEDFIPVDTEAIEPAMRRQLGDWCRAHRLDAILSTDGDADRPMLCGPDGAIIPGDVLGVLTAKTMSADILCTPVSSNSMAEQLGFTRVERTKIGSPYVIAAIEAALAENPAARVVGYEANGGFLLGFAARGPAGPIAPLMTRDAVLPMLAPLVLARAQGFGLAALLTTLPRRFTAADRLSGIAPERSAALLARLQDDPGARAEFFAADAPERALDLTDGLRVSFENGRVVHLRPSGNAPELRCYGEAESSALAAALVSAHLKRLNDQLA